MKAIVYDEFGPPDVLRLADVDLPTPKEREVLIKIRAAAVNPLDWHFIRGEPSIMRMFGKPKARIPGVDVAGTVEGVGPGVTRFSVGDEVFGSCRGAFAEYVSANEGSLAPKPARLNFEQAAAMPVAAFTALRALREYGHVQPGQGVLVNGASGGVGTFAVQIAKSLGAEVTGVCSARNVELVRSLGADHVIDYTAEDFTRQARTRSRRGSGASASRWCSDEGFGATTSMRSRSWPKPARSGRSSTAPTCSLPRPRRSAMSRPDTPEARWS
jgi:NADPH:quinone reductase-like Zn-dependent oxidoreductase